MPPAFPGAPSRPHPENPPTEVLPHVRIVHDGGGQHRLPRAAHAHDSIGEEGEGLDRVSEAIHSSLYRSPLHVVTRLGNRSRGYCGHPWRARRAHPSYERGNLVGLVVGPCLAAPPSLRQADGPLEGHDGELAHHLAVNPIQFIAHGLEFGRSLCLDGELRGDAMPSADCAAVYSPTRPSTLW